MTATPSPPERLGPEADERAALARELGKLVLRLESGQDRGGETASLAERLATPAAGFLQPELERLLTRYVDADHCVARDRIAHILTGACGLAALPALLRARVKDRNDNGDTLELDVLELFEAFPAEALAQVMSCIAADDPGVRRVGIWGLSVLDWSQKDEYIELVVKAGSDADAELRSEAIASLGSVFGAGHPRAREAVMAATRDREPEVRCSAVGALHSWPDEAVTELLVSCADDEDRRVRFWVAWALSPRPGTAARAALERLSADDDAEVRAAAKQVLKQSSD
jgi:hypothetical protein